MPTWYGFGRSRSAHLFAQKSAYSGRSSSASMSFSRFFGVGVGEEGSRFVRRRQPADDVEVRAAVELARRCASSDGVMPSCLQLGPDVAVDEVVAAAASSYTVGGDWRRAAE